MRFERQTYGSATARARSLRRRMTWSEQQLWKELRKLKANFRRQAPIGRYFADFAAHGSKLVVEVDGGVHERLDHVALRDAERQCWLEGEGCTVLRFSDRDVEGDVHVCRDQVKAALCAAGWIDPAGPEPSGAKPFILLGTPPSPALPPSRRKGA